MCVKNGQELRFSLVVPLYNEEDNVAPLLNELHEVLPPLGSFEVLIIDDGSTDKTLPLLMDWQRRHDADWLRILPLAKNGGQSAATVAGADCARAPIVCTMDGDLQNDPRDIGKMLEIIESGEADGVCGVRAKRKDTFVRKVSSRIGNGVRNWITGDKVTDSACGLKAFKRELLVQAPRFSGMHRFLTSLVRFIGGKVVEIPVNHRVRHAGEAKYGVGNRALRGLKDCFAVRWYRKRIVLYEVRELPQEDAG